MSLVKQTFLHNLLPFYTLFTHTQEFRKLREVWAIKTSILPSFERKREVMLSFLLIFFSINVPSILFQLWTTITFVTGHLFLLADTMELEKNAKIHVVSWGNSSDYTQTWLILSHFGSGLLFRVGSPLFAKNQTNTVRSLYPQNNSCLYWVTLLDLYRQTDPKHLAKSEAEHSLWLRIFFPGLISWTTSFFEWLLSDKE